MVGLASVGEYELSSQWGAAGREREGLGKESLVKEEGNGSSQAISARIWRSYRTSLTASRKAKYSDSSIEVAIIACRFDCQDTGAPRRNMNAPTDLRLIALLAQSASVNPTREG